LEDLLVEQKLPPFYESLFFPISNNSKKDTYFDLRLFFNNAKMVIVLADNRTPNDDPKSNNIRVYVVSSFVEMVRSL